MLCAMSRRELSVLSSLEFALASAHGEGEGRLGTMGTSPTSTRW